jgi:hypothetical protein
MGAFHGMTETQKDRPHLAKMAMMRAIFCQIEFYVMDQGMLTSINIGLSI